MPTLTRPTSASGSVEVYTNRYDSTVAYIRAAAQALDVTVAVGPARISGATGFFRCRTFTHSSLTFRGDRRDIVLLLAKIDRYIGRNG